MKKIISYIKGMFLFPYYTYTSYKLLKKITSGRGKTDKEIWRDKIIMSGGLIDSNYIQLFGLKFKNSFKNLLLIIVENLYHQKYNFFDSKHDYICIDIGANVGVSSLFLADKNNIRKIYAFEPLRPTFALLVENMGLNPKHSEKIEARNVGLSDKNQSIEVKFNLDQSMSTSSKSVFDKCFPEYSMEHIEVEDACVALEPIVQKHLGQERLFLKIDCEGAEYDIIPHLAKHGLLAQMDVVIIEFHDNKPNSLLEILEREGFFCFCEWERREGWEIGFIKAVKS